MQLWGMDIVGGVMLVSPVTGEVREAKVFTAVDDHSRYCVSAKVVEHATSRAVCLAFAQVWVRFGVPQEVLTDIGKQFTDRFGKGGEVLFDKICRKNAITHRLTAPASPNQNGKVGRFHGTFRPDFLDVVEPFISVEEAQAAVDAWVAHYNTDRPHHGLDDKLPVTPAQRFHPEADQDRSCSTCGFLRPWSAPQRSPRPGLRLPMTMTMTGREFERGVGCAWGVDRWAGRVRPGGATKWEHDRHEAAVLDGHPPGRGWSTGSGPTPT